MDWFSHLPTLSRRSILIKGFIAAAVAFVIGMGAVYAVEQGIGNSLSCGLWSNCPEGAKPGIHLVGDRDAGAGSSLSLGRAKPKTAAGYEENQRLDQGPGYQRNVFQQQQQQEDRSFRQESHGYRQPADSGGGEPRRQSRGGILEPEPQVQQEAPAQQQEQTPSTASPAPEEGPVQEVAPSGESPAPSQ
jgi:hypothetical protein